MKSLKIYLSIFCLLFSMLASANEYCDYSEITDNFKLCSDKPISKNIVNYTVNAYTSSYEHFLVYIARYNLKLKTTDIPLIIYVLDFSVLNDPNLFSRPKGQTLLGKYVDGGTLYVSNKSLTKYNTDLIHELAHYYIDNIGNVDFDLNESLAVKFEKYYIDNL